MARQRRVLVPPMKGERMPARSSTPCARRRWSRSPIGRAKRAFSSLPRMRRITLRVILRTAIGLVPGLKMDRFEQKIERVLANGRQRYALVMMTILPIERFSGSRWIPMFRQLSDLDDDLFARSRPGERDNIPP